MIEENGRLRNLEAENYILNQRIATEWIYADDEWKKQARLFCVKGLAQIDLLKNIQAELAKAQQEGTGFQDFKKALMGKLKAEGWLGGDEKTLSRRLDIIYKTNTASARAEAKWAKIQKTKEIMPYLQYLPSFSADKREEHKAFYGLVAKADDPIWKRIFPPNGYGCKCRVRQLTEEQALRIIKEQEENGGIITVSDEAINKAVDSSFQHSPQALGGLPAYIDQKHGAGVVNKLLQGVLDNPKGLATSEEFEIFREGADFVQKNAVDLLSREYAKNPVSILPALLKKNGVELDSISNKYSITAKQEIKTAMDIAVSLLPKNWVDECNKYGKIILEEKLTNKGEHFLLGEERAEKLKKAWNDAYPQLGDFIAPQANDSWIEVKNSKFLVSDCLHEFSHRIQNFLPKLNQYYLGFYERRTKSNAVASLISFPEYSYLQDPTIKTKPDNFFDPYLGRIYADLENEGKFIEGKEMMPRCFEYLFSPFNCRDFLEKDFELFAFTIGLFLRSGR